MFDVTIARTDLLAPAAVERLRRALPEERRRRADAFLRESDRRASIVAFAMLQRRWRECDGGRMPPLVIGPRGKPRFIDGLPPHFNWSHDGDVCVCVTADVPVGIDAQSRIPFDDSLFERMAAPEELGGREVLRAEDDLSLLWTRKEAIVKRDGRGISAPLQLIDALGARDVVTFAGSDPDVRLSLCGAQVAERGAVALRHAAFDGSAWTTHEVGDAFRRVDAALAVLCPT